MRDEGWQAEQANRLRLDGCRGPHAFSVVKTASTIGTGDLFRCTRCGGEASARFVHWYNRGLRDEVVLAKRSEAAP